MNFKNFNVPKVPGGGVPALLKVGLIGGLAACGAAYSLFKVPAGHRTVLGDGDKDENIYYLHTDATQKPKKNNYSCVGGLVRKRDGIYHDGFIMKLGYCKDIMEAEARGIKEGVQFCKDMNYNKVKAYSDNEIVVSLLNAEDDEVVAKSSISNIIEETKKITTGLDHFEITHIAGEENKSAHIMCRMGPKISAKEGQRSRWKNPPRKIIKILKVEANRPPFKD